MRQNLEEMQATQKELIRKEKETKHVLDQFSLVSKTTSEGLWDMTVPKDSNIHDKTQFMWSDQLRYILRFNNENKFPDVLNSWSDLLHPNHSKSTIDAFSAHLFDINGKTPYNITYQLKLKNGTYRWFHAVGNTLRDDKGNPKRVAGCLIDIQASKDIQLLQEELENKVNNQNAEFESTI